MTRVVRRSCSRWSRARLFRSHEHTKLEQTYVLEGSLEDDEGVCSAGNFVWRPGGNTHIAHSPKGAVILSIFTAPNRFLDGTHFFTEK